ncbi:MAG: Pre-mRNA-splicing factor 18, partial [Watsoniomyces obsoletus]
GINRGLTSLMFIPTGIPTERENYMYTMNPTPTALSISFLSSRSPSPFDPVGERRPPNPNIPPAPPDENVPTGRF